MRSVSHVLLMCGLFVLGARANAQQIGPQTTPPPAASPTATAQTSAPPASQPAPTGTAPSTAAPDAATAPTSPSPSTPVSPTASAPIIVPVGTRLPLVLHNAITTRNAQPGDPIYLETLFPIVQNDKILIPAGSYVQGEIMEAKRPGRVKGRGELRVRLTTMILPNGYTVSFVGVPSNAGTGGNESVDKEGTIKGDTNKAGDAGTVITDTGVGTAIGGIAGRSGEGAGIGAGVGLAAGLITVLLTRGPELELPRGTTLDIVLDRDLRLDPNKITFTDPGKASTLAGPPNREPQRSTFPF
jgi:type IV secretion system protein VirB10